MTSYDKKALLPAGFHDLLAEDAAFSGTITSTLTDAFQSYGYHYVAPPLIEFEASLFSGQGKALSEQTFRLMDPHSHKMMGIRPDITMQIVRIATTRLKNEPLPIRLSYGGEVLRIKGTYLYGERQLSQAGIELIGGHDTVGANAEVVIVALDALKRLGIADLSVDFNLPGLTPILLHHSTLDKEAKHALQQALNKKDSAQVEKLAAEDAPLLLALLSPSGNVDDTLALLNRETLPEEARLLGDNLAKVIALVRAAEPTINLTIDPLEYRGFEYHTGIGFSIFSRTIASEIGRGGRYKIENPANPSQDEAVGVTLDVSTLLRILPVPARTRHIYVPFGTSYRVSDALRAEGMVTIQGLNSSCDPREDAVRMGCDAIYSEGVITAIKDYD